MFVFQLPFLFLQQQCQHKHSRQGFLLRQEVRGRFRILITNFLGGFIGIIIQFAPPVNRVFKKNFVARRDVSCYNGEKDRWELNKMTVSESKKKSNAAWDKANMERLTIKYRKGLTAEIKARAAELGKPVNRYIVDLIRQDMDANSGK